MALLLPSRTGKGRQDWLKRDTISVMGILLRLLISAVSLWIATLLISGIRLTDDTFSLPWFGTLLLVTIIFGVVNGVLRPLIKMIGCAFYVLTLGLIALVVNGALLWLTGWISEQLEIGFAVDNFWPSAILGALIIGVASWLLNIVIKDR